MFISFLAETEPVIREYAEACIAVNQAADDLNWYVRNGVRTNVNNDRRFRAIVRRYNAALENEAEARANVRNEERARLSGLRLWVYNRLVH